MKRILILCLLLIISFGNVEAGRADSYGFGSAIFDDQKTMLENLTSIFPEIRRRFMVERSPQELLGATRPYQYVALIGVSKNVVGTNQDDSFAILEGSSTILQSYLTGVYSTYWTEVPRDLASLSLRWKLPSSSGAMAVYSLAEILSWNFCEATVSGGAYYGRQTTPYKVDGNKNFLLLPYETFFIGLDLCYYCKNEVDIILAFSPYPFKAVLPIPAAIWLLSTGVVGIAAMRRRIN